MSEKKAKSNLFNFFTFTCTVHNCTECPYWSRYNRNTIDKTASYCTTGVEERAVKNPDILPRWCPMRGC